MIESAAAPRPLITVVAPAFNEQECIAEFVAEIIAEIEEHVGRLGRSYELIVVDDGSTDGTLAILEKVARKTPLLKIVALDGNGGQSVALAAGIAHARGEFIALTDADMQSDPADIGRMLDFLQSHANCACVVGVRKRRSDSWLRKISSRLANWCASRITRDSVSDAACSLKLFRSHVLARLPLFRGAHRFFATLVRMDGGQVAEMEVNHRPRLKGRSKYGSGLGRTFVALRDALGVRWLIDRRLHYEIRASRSER